MKQMDIEEKWQDLVEWKDTRPFWGAVFMIVGSLFIAWVPFNMTSALFLGNTVAVVGLLWAVLLFIAGSFSLFRPDLHDILGIAGAFFSITSVFGALGGMFVGLFLGLAGGSMAYAWIPPDERPDSSDKSYGTASDMQRDIDSTHKNLKEKLT